MYGVQHDAITIDRHVAHRSHIVKTVQVVEMIVGDEHGIQMTDMMRESLLTEVGATIDEDASTLRLNERGTTKTTITRVRRVADLAIATDEWDAGGGTGAQKRQFARYLCRIRHSFG